MLHTAGASPRYRRCCFVLRVPPSLDRCDVVLLRSCVTGFGGQFIFSDFSLEKREIDARKMAHIVQASAGAGDMDDIRMRRCGVERKRGESERDTEQDMRRRHVVPNSPVKCWKG